MIGNDVTITVIMAVYNSEKFLEQSIESILSQTFKEFRFLIINDGSTDGSKKLIQSYNDERIVLVNNANNLGLTKSLNKGISLTKSKYIVRMDADDIAFKNRLQVQFEFMEKNKDIGILGSQVIHFYDEGGRKKFKYKDLHHKSINAALLCYNPIMHPTVMIRNDILTFNNIKYDEKLVASQDYGLWVEMSHVTKIINLPDTLLYYRVSNNNVTNTSKKDSVERHMIIFENAFDKIGCEFSSDELNNYTLAVYKPSSNVDYKKLDKVMYEISKASKKNKQIDINTLKNKLGYIWVKSVILSMRMNYIFSKWTLYGVRYIVLHTYMENKLLLKNIKLLRDKI